MKGGVILFRGTGSAACRYLESDRSRADDYYLENRALAAFTVIDGGGEGQQTLAWTYSTRKASVGSQAYQTMPTTMCLDAIVDWMTVSNHYDARDARNCAPGTSRSGTITEPANWGNRDVTGLQKAAGCRYLQQTTTPSTYGECEYAPETHDWPNCQFDPDEARPWTHKSHAVFLRAENGTTDSNDGGDVWKSDS